MTGLLEQHQTGGIDKNSPLGKILDIAGTRPETLSKEAQAVMDAGRKLWKAYFSEKDTPETIAALKLGRPDVGWYQIRMALKRRNEIAGYNKFDFTEFNEAYEALTKKLQPQVYELGFLRK